MKKLITLGLIVLGASALTFTIASANCASGKEAPKTMKCQAGKCGGADKKKEMKCQSGKCDGNKTEVKEKIKKEVKGKCGQGKCGGGK